MVVTDVVGVVVTDVVGVVVTVVVGEDVAVLVAVDVGLVVGDVVFVVVGDGELHEGANWEAIMFASQHNLDNLHLIVDDNRISMLDFTDKIVSHANLNKRLEAFGWGCDDCDGHNVLAIQSSLKALKEEAKGKPKALIARTLKGRGVPGLENEPLAHILNPKSNVIERLLEDE